MSFDTDLKKLQKLWDSGQSNKFIMDVTRTKLSKQGQQIEELNPRILDFSHIMDVGGKWEDIKILADQLGGWIAQTEITNGFLWDIKLTNVPKNFIPMVRVNLGYDFLGVDPTADAQICQFVEINPSTNSFTPNIVTIIWHVAFVIPTSVQPPDFNLKLYLTILNPNLFV